jgi:alcohol dehydrogenase (NADP+)
VLVQCILFEGEFRLSKALAYAATSKTSPMAPITISRRDFRANDVNIEILYCGVCHTDIHTAHAEWDGLIYPNGTVYPCVPGHEIVGRVTSIGPAATRFSVGEFVAVGTMVDSCLECDNCKAGLEPYCRKYATWTYNAPDRITGDNTQGGYSDSIVVREEFVLKLNFPAESLAAVAPLLCAGITMWSPLRHWNIGIGSKVGIVGIGGLGHMGIKLARARGAHVVAFTTSESKRESAMALGAQEVVVSHSPEEMNSQAGKLDFILNTVAVPHNLDAYLALLCHGGTMALVGIPEKPHPSPSVASLIGLRRSLAGSLVGGIAETQEMLDFCAENDVLAETETISMQEIETAFDRMVRNDVKYRFVVDMKSLKADA